MVYPYDDLDELSDVELMKKIRWWNKCKCEICQEIVSNMTKYSEKRYSQKKEIVHNENITSQSCVK